MGRPKGSWTGAANPKWKGGRYTAANGYVFIKKPDHPNSDKRGYVREHDFVMSEIVGRAIAKDEIVHHINEIKNDNRPENLELMKRGQHHSLHHKGLIKPNSLKNLKPMTSEWQKEIWASGVKDHLRAKPRICDNCHKEFQGQRLLGRKKHKHQFCGRACFQEFRKKTH